ncbi:sugar O-acetyltransferase [Gymnodinialimonas hymeniacidonis]|uniref:sugar O-acetyltransferase n=1 Tax=Gymnodinialimonas hymeniacidonis TaxID=3126508 RepID=UPI0034C5B70D
MTEREKMEAGEWYCCLDPALQDLQTIARTACHQHRTQAPGGLGELTPELAALFAEVGENAMIEAPFHCSFGFNTFLGRAVYINANCVILDSGRVTIGDRTMIGPAVQIYCADHHRDVKLRRQGIERALPVTIGTDVWIGGGAILMPGITVGDEAIIGAGAVVTKDVAPGTRVVGNPARPLA